MTPTRTNRPLGAIPSSPSSGALTPAQPIALARRPRGIALTGALVDIHRRLRHKQHAQQPEHLALSCSARHEHHARPTSDRRGTSSTQGASS